MNQTKSNLPGVFNVYKPPGVTSLSVVNHFKYNLPIRPKKIGHFGTLDPFAEGVLLIALDSANRLSNLVHESYPKTYFAEGLLGIKTNSGDCMGEVVDQQLLLPEALQSLTLEEINQKVQAHFLGEYWQAPPAFSASKHLGRPLYAWAREGVMIEKSAVKRELLALEITEIQFPKMSFNVTVSSGTYVRTLFEDMASFLGSLGHLTRLVRTSIGEYKSKDSLVKEFWPKICEMEGFIPLTQFFPCAQLQLEAAETVQYKNGRILEFVSVLEEQDLCWVKGVEQNLLGLARRIPTAQGYLLKAEMNLPIM